MRGAIPPGGLDLVVGLLASARPDAVIAGTPFHPIPESVDVTFISNQVITVIVPPATAPGPVELFHGDDIGCFAVPIPFCCSTYNSSETPSGASLSTPSDPACNLEDLPGNDPWS